MSSALKSKQFSAKGITRGGYRRVEVNCWQVGLGSKSFEDKHLRIYLTLLSAFYLWANTFNYINNNEGAITESGCRGYFTGEVHMTRGVDQVNKVILII